MQFGGDIGIGPEDIGRLEPEIAYVTSNSDIEAIALVTDSGYQIAYAAINRSIDSDALCGIASALTSTSNMVTKTVFNENLSEVIVRAGNGYIVVSNAGRFVLVGAAQNIQNMMKTVKVFRVAAQRIASQFPRF